MLSVNFAKSRVMILCFMTIEIKLDYTNKSRFVLSHTLLVLCIVYTLHSQYVRFHFTKLNSMRCVSQTQRNKRYFYSITLIAIRLTRKITITSNGSKSRWTSYAKVNNSGFKINIILILGFLQQMFMDSYNFTVRIKYS